MLPLSLYPDMPVRNSPWGLAKLAVCPIVIPREEGEGVGPKDAGDGALKAPLGELAACKFPNQRYNITTHTFPIFLLFFLSTATVLCFLGRQQTRFTRICACTQRLYFAHAWGLYFPNWFTTQKKLSKIFDLKNGISPLPSPSPSLNTFSCCTITAGNRKLSFSGKKFLWRNGYLKRTGFDWASCKPEELNGPKRFTQLQMTPLPRAFFF